MINVQMLNRLLAYLVCFQMTQMFIENLALYYLSRNN